jgi:hypothetical protein
MSEQISQASGQSVGTDLHEIKLGPACFVKPAADTVMMPEPSFEETKHLYSNKPLIFRKAPIIQDIEAIEDEIDLKDAIKSLNEPGSIRLSDFKKKLGI